MTNTVAETAVAAAQAASAAPLNLAAIGAALVTIGVGIGIGWIVSTALSGMARQPEMAPKMQTLMLIGAALVEGLALFAMVICFLSLT
jgi:F-type H+-transporting ATPase subunit c